MSLNPTAITHAAAIVTAALLAALVLFQVALALGAPWGRAAYGGRSAELSPSLRVSSAVAVVLWSAAALVVLRRAGLTEWAPLPDAWLGVAMWVLVGLGALAVIMNAITRSALERAIWLPFSVLLLGGFLTVATASAMVDGGGLR